VAKFTVFAASVEAREYALTAVGVLTTAIALFFYLRLVVVMYMSSPAEVEAAGLADAAVAATDGSDGRPFALDPATGLALAVAVVATLVMGILPGGFINFAESAKLLF
jgi:NADH-quinone oxidoreductase subunit N